VVDPAAAAVPQRTRTFRRANSRSILPLESGQPQNH